MVRTLNERMGCKSRIHPDPIWRLSYIDILLIIERYALIVLATSLDAGSGRRGVGRLQWKRLLGTDTDDWSSGVTTDSKGNVYITGTTFGSLIGRNRGKSDAWFAKYSTQR